MRFAAYILALAAGIGGLPCGWQVDFKNGDTMKEPAHPVLAANPDASIR